MSPLVAARRVVRHVRVATRRSVGPIRDGPPLLRDRPPLLRDGPPLLRDGPPLLRDGPPLLRDGPPLLRDGPPHLRTRAIRDGEGQRELRLDALLAAVASVADPFVVRRPSAFSRCARTNHWNCSSWAACPISMSWV